MRNLASKKARSPHTLIELSTKQWERLGKNSIVVKGLITNCSVKKNPTLSYSSVTYGANIILKRKCCESNGKSLHWKRPQLKNIKGGYILIVGDKLELMETNDDLIVVDGSSQENDHKSINDRYKPSGKVILSLCKLHQQHNNTYFSWGKSEAKLLKKSKHNVMKGHSSHFGSTGDYYSFGNRANYGMINNSSVTQYVSKKYTSGKKTLVAKKDAEHIERMGSRDIDCGIKNLCTVIPNLIDYISPTLNVAYNLQKDIGDFNLKKMEHSETGLWQAAVCVSCQTSHLHTENDCTYTVITTPRQETCGRKRPEYNFIFELKKGETIGLELETGISFIYSAKYLNHRQSYNENSGNASEVFINLASYGNERLYNHLKSTMKRIYK